MFYVIGCPQLAATHDVRAALKAERFCSEGKWPVAGGWLDQTMKCLEAIEFIEHENAEWERRKKEES